MRWYACQLGFADEVDFWGMVGLLHDIDFEQYPEEHCVKAPELLREVAWVIPKCITSQATRRLRTCSACAYGWRNCGSATTRR